MRVAYLTAGAGSMYCGSCLRDNTLVAALRRAGRDVLLIPLYTPIRTDEEDVSEASVYYGGINVYLEQKFALFRHTPWLVDRLLNSPALLRMAMKKAGSVSTEGVGPLVVSMLRGEHGSQRKELEKLIAGLAEFKPDLVHLPDALFVGLAGRLREALGVPVVCTLTGEDILLDKLHEHDRAEAVRLMGEGAADVDRFIAVTRYYAGYASEQFGIPADRIAYVPMGIRIEPEGPAPRTTHRAGGFSIGYFARICPEKGLHILCEAFKILRSEGRACRLKIGGYLGASDRPYFEGIQRHMAEALLDDAIEYAGEQDRAGKLAFLRSIDVLSVPTVYREAKGLYVLEAMAESVPVVQPAHGSFPELIEATGGGVLVAPENPSALTAALEDLMDDPDRVKRLGEQGRRRVRESFHDGVMAAEAWKVFEEVREVAAESKRRRG